MRRILRRIRQWRDRDALAEEIETHRALSQAALERSGWADGEAARESRRRIGNTTRAIEDARAVWIPAGVERAAGDARHALRALRREPTFALTAIITLALAIGASTAVFSVVNAAAWTPLPFPDADRLVAIFTTGAGRATHDRTTAPELRAWQESAGAVEEIAAFAGSARRITRGDDVPASLVTLPVTANFFRTLRMAPALGRLFEPRPDADAGAAILTDACWRSAFAGDPTVIGRAVTLDGLPFVVVGVTAPDARLDFITSPDLFVTIDPGTDRDHGSRRDLRAIGRLAAGATLDTATADLRRIAGRLALEQPAANARRSVHVEDLRAAYTGWNWRPLFFFLGAAAFVLLLASVNVASLLIARALRRQRELALRRALGGGTATIACQLLVEGAVLSAIGAAAGLLLAAWAVHALPVWLPPEYLGRDVRLAIDSRSLLATLGVTLVTTLVFGCAPAAFNRIDLRHLLADGGRTVGGSRLQQRARHALVAVEVAIALVLMVGAGLFLNSFARLTHVPLGFEPHERITMRIPVSGPRYATPGAVAVLGDTLLDHVRAIPGVRSAALASSTALDGGRTTRFLVPGSARPAAGDEPGGIGRAVSPGYFRTLGTDLLAGRDFNAADDEQAPRVAIVNQHLVRRLFGGASPIGRVLEILPDTSSTWIGSGPVEIVGLSSNSKDVGLNEVDFNAIYFPFHQQPPSSIQLVVRSGLPSGQVAAAVRRELTAVAPDLPLYGVRTMDALVADALQSDRLNLLLIGTFAALATLMAGVGIYGAMSYAMEQRTQEFGVRIALGARRRAVLGLALGWSVRLGIAGTFFGLLAALLVARLAGTGLYLVEGVHEGLLYGVATTDPLTLTCACAALLATATLAGLAPALRATRVDPIVALRRD